MLIVRHLGIPNSPFSLTSMDFTGCVFQYYTDQWSGHLKNHFLTTSNCTISTLLPIQYTRA